MASVVLSGPLGDDRRMGANIGMALIVASGLGFLRGVEGGAARAASRMLYSAIGILIAAIIVLAYANSLA
jgi:hypothetical protein